MGCLTCAKTRASFFNNVTIEYNSLDSLSWDSLTLEKIFIDFKDIVFKSEQDKKMQQFLFQKAHLPIRICDAPCITEGFVLKLTYGNDGMGWMIWTGSLHVDLKKKVFEKNLNCSTASLKSSMKK